MRPLCGLQRVLLADQRDEAGEVDGNTESGKGETVKRCPCGNKAGPKGLCAPCARSEELDLRRSGRIFRTNTIKANDAKREGPRAKVKRAKFKVPPSDRIHIKRGPNANKRG